MIHQVLPAIAIELNKFLKSVFNITEDKVILSGIVNADGSIAIQETDKIILTMAGIEPERSKSETGTYVSTPRGSFTRLKPPISVNIYMLFSAYFTTENYVEGLKFLTSVIGFFQSRGGVFTPQNTPALDVGIERLVAELVPLEFRDISNLWGSLGAKYIPSILFRLKTLSIEHLTPTPEIPAINKI